MARCGMAALHLGKELLVHLCSNMSTLYLSLCLMQTTEVMTVWLMLSPLVLEWLMMKMTLSSSAERPDFRDRSLQLAAPGLACVRGKDSEDMVC